MSQPSDAKHSPLRLSASLPKRKPRREFTESEIGALGAVADTLIPAKGSNLSGSAVANFRALVTRAATILDSQFEELEALLREVGEIHTENLWNWLKDLDRSRPRDFYLISLIVTAAYVYSEEMKEALKYPVPHQNPAGMFEIADELSSGILDPVMERGPIYVSAK
ncbi:hypothetical protein [Rhizobium sp. 18055]|uniref:hypothetical protein n=1 Tax=Rhizobium sp. 18055 TaxID=2681403 RepID=UPI00135AE5EB|nr:hypothetical protein [Rhizobium sp. 18055]